MLEVSAESPNFLRHWTPIENLGCRYEGVDGKLLAVAVPPSADVHEVYRPLEAGEAGGVWDFEEGHCGLPVEGPTTTTT